MRRAVDVATASGHARNFLYAMHICNGYDPCDGLFWALMKTPSSDRSWLIVAPDIIAERGVTVDIPIDILYRQ